MIDLLTAAKNGNVQQVRQLLASGFPVDTGDRHGTTALMFAANFGYTEIVRCLLDFGADIDLPRKLHGLTALMLAAAHNQVDVVKLLTSQGANTNAVNEDGSTALMIAVEKGYIETVQNLLDFGADPKIVDQHNEDAFKLAIRQNNRVILNILVKTVKLRVKLKAC